MSNFNRNEVKAYNLGYRVNENGDLIGLKGKPVGSYSGMSFHTSIPNLLFNFAIILFCFIVSLILVSDNTQHTSDVLYLYTSLGIVPASF